MLATALAVLCVSAACAPAASGPTGGQAPSRDTAAGGGAAPTGSTSSEWDQTVAAAKQEGKLVILGPPGADAREALTANFQKRYPEIQIEFNSASGAQTAPKILTERQAGQYLGDMHIGGTTTMLTSLVPVGALDPIQSFLVGPDTRDQSPWLNNKFDFSDDAGTYNLVFTSAVKAPLAYHPRQVNIAEIKSYRDLLDPKWRGKVSMRDPRTAGPGLATATFLYMTPSLGPDYLRQFLNSGVIFSTDDRQILDWVARGQYPIALAPSELETAELSKKGLPIQLQDAHEIQEGSYLTAAFGSVAVLNRAPHPNATKVYLNWLLSKEGQTDWSVASGYPSRRMDIPTDHLTKATIPRPGVQYQENYKEPYVVIKTELDAFLENAIPR
jgi:iron(III) transport system substrate-binding protein